jgi:hypothetical protein
MSSTGVMFGNCCPSSACSLGTTAVPRAKNSNTWLPQPWLFSWSGCSAQARRSDPSRGDLRLHARGLEKLLEISASNSHPPAEPVCRQRPAADPAAHRLRVGPQDPRDLLHGKKLLTLGGAIGETRRSNRFWWHVVRAARQCFPLLMPDTRWSAKYQDNNTTHHPGAHRARSI